MHGLTNGTLATYRVVEVMSTPIGKAHTRALMGLLAVGKPNYKNGIISSHQLLHFLGACDSIQEQVTGSLIREPPEDGAQIPKCVSDWMA
jgi:hypothetical protein